MYTENELSEAKKILKDNNQDFILEMLEKIDGTVKKKT